MGGITGIVRPIISHPAVEDGWVIVVLDSRHKLVIETGRQVNKAVRRDSYLYIKPWIEKPLLWMKVVIGNAQAGLYHDIVSQPQLAFLVHSHLHRLLAQCKQRGIEGGSLIGKKQLFRFEAPAQLPPVCAEIGPVCAEALVIHDAGLGYFLVSAKGEIGVKLAGGNHRIGHQLGRQQLPVVEAVGFVAPIGVQAEGLKVEVVPPQIPADRKAVIVRQVLKNMPLKIVEVVREIEVSPFEQLVKVCAPE